MPTDTPQIAVVGAGHAGVEAARTAAAQGGRVVLFSAETALPYFRPRIVALAFGQAAESDLTQHPAAWYAANGIDLRLGSPVEAVDPASRSVRAAGREGTFDSIVLATGAVPCLADWCRAAPDRILPLWALDHALRIRPLARRGEPLAVVGGGIIGLEVALRAADAGLPVTLIEKGDRLMPGYFGPSGSRLLAAILGRHGIRVLTSRSVASARKDGPDRVLLELDDGTRIEASLAIVCMGARRNLALAQRAGLRTGHGIAVDAGMRASTEAVFACGDIAEADGQRARGSVPVALAQARVAGHNACAARQGRPCLSYRPKPAILSFQYQDVALRSVGAVPAHAAEESAIEGNGEWTHRVRVLRGGATAGVQMIGDCRDFEKYAGNIQEATL